MIVPMPLPWSSQYLYYWDRFLVDLATRYGKDQALVSVIMAGPTCATTEMILPTKDNMSLQYSGDDADQAWKTPMVKTVLRGTARMRINPAQIFVDYWTLAIDTYVC